MDETRLLNALYGVWDRCNARFFDASLTRPVIEFGSPRAPSENATFYPARPDGRPRCGIRESIMSGTHPEMKEGDEYWQGRGRFVADLMLRLMVRQWVQDWHGQTEDNYRGYRPLFRNKANEIGRTMALEPLRTFRDKSKERTNLPVCSGWPHNRRRAQYYLGADEPRTSKKTALEKAEEMLGKLSLSELRELQSRLPTMIQEAEERRSKAMAVQAELIKNSDRQTRVTLEVHEVVFVALAATPSPGTARELLRIGGSLVPAFCIGISLGLLRHSPMAGFGCGNFARTDLYGGVGQPAFAPSPLQGKRCLTGECSVKYSCIWHNILFLRTGRASCWGVPGFLFKQGIASRRNVTRLKR